MRPRCVAAVTAAIGRPLRAGEDRQLLDELRVAMRQLQAQSPAAFGVMTEPQRLQHAAQIAAQRFTEAAIRRQRNAALQILARTRIHDAIANHNGTAFDFLDRMMALKTDQRSGVLSIESQKKAIRAFGISQLAEALDANNGEGWRQFSYDQGVIDIVREAHGQQTGNAAAARIAQAFRDVAEQNRQRFNEAGGNIGHLDDWGVPHSHSQQKMAREGLDAWRNFITPLLDRNRYIRPDGRMMNDQELSDFLAHAYDTITLNGRNKQNGQGIGGPGSVANKGSAHRQIHFASGDAWARYQARFGERDLINIMVGHIDGMARDIALIETLGPNPHSNIQAILQQAENQAVLADRVNEKDYVKQRKKIERLYDEVAGLKDPPISQQLADGFSAYRSLNVASRLGSAVLTGIVDQGVMGTVAGMNRLPVMKVFANELKMLNPANGEHRVLARRAGLGVESMMGTLSRWGSDGLGDPAYMSSRVAKWSSKMAEAVMKYSGMEAMTEGSRRAFGSVMLDTLGNLTRNHADLSSLHSDDARILRASGVTDAEWQVWRLAQPEDWRGAGDTVLTPRSIMDIPDAALDPIAQAAGMSVTRLRNSAVTRLLGHVLDETSVAIIEPGARERALMNQGSQRGTWGGEIVRSFWLFRGFSIAMMMRHFTRAAAMPGWGKAKYSAGIMLSSTILGAMAMQLNSVVSGREPEDMDSGTFWTRAFLKGGALGIYGDFLLADQTQYGSSFAGIMGGVALGDIENTYQLLGLAKKAVSNDSYSTGQMAEDLGANAARLVKSHIPFANLWYTKAITDHLFWNQVQEALSPGYLDRMKTNARRKYGQEFWWSPEDMTP